jgi:hypothetical protein
VWNQNMDSFTHVTLAETGWRWELDPSCCRWFRRCFSPLRASCSVKIYGWWLKAYEKRLYPVFRGFYMCLEDAHALFTRGTALGSRIPLVGSNFLSQNVSIYGNSTRPNCMTQKKWQIGILSPQSETDATPQSNNHFYWLTITTPYNK